MMNLASTKRRKPIAHARVHGDGSALRSALVPLLALQIGSGCAFQRKDPASPAFVHAALRSEVALTEDHRLEGDLQARSTITGALVGGGSLALAGAGIGAGVGLACGWLAVVCSPFFAA